MSEDVLRDLERKRRLMEDHLQEILGKADRALGDNPRDMAWRSVRWSARRGLELPHDGTHGDDY